MPSGLDNELVESIFEQDTKAKPGAISHVQISGWRKPTSGTFRVFVDTNDSSQWSFVFKNAMLTVDETPGIAGLPANPGLPEYCVYQQGFKHLRSYLPIPFAAREIEPSVHCQ